MLKYRFVYLKLLFLGVSLSDAYKHIPLPGLETKPHLHGLTREDIQLNLVHEQSGPDVSIDSNDLPYHLTDDIVKSQQEIDARYELEEVKKRGVEDYHGQKINNDNQFNEYMGTDPFLKARFGQKHPQVQAEAKIEGNFESRSDKSFFEKYGITIPEPPQPEVYSGAAYCARSVDRLKAGPANVPELLHCGVTNFSDTTFNRTDQVWWSDYNTASSYSTYNNYLNNGYYHFKNWTDQYTSANIFDPDGSVHFNESIQGGAGTCYMIATLSALGEFPQLVKNMFWTEEKNNARMHMIRFYIRGKPWVVSVDEEFLFKSNTNPSLVFTKVADDKNAMWAAIMEKAWAKVRGNYINANGGFFENAFHVTLGAPVFGYKTSAITTDADVETAYQRILAADAANYIMGATTAGSGNDQVLNTCGIAMSHAYSILAAFSMTDASGTEHKCVLVRNPWGLSYYNKAWNKNDPNWTDALVAQVPWQIDVRTQQAQMGVFVVPLSLFKGTACFANYQIAHYRDSEGYSDTWYDKEDDTDGTMSIYTFDVPAGTSSDIYFSVSSYSWGIIPMACTTGSLSNGQSAQMPVAYIAVYNGGTRLSYQFYFDQYHRPILRMAGSHPGQYRVYVGYEYVGSPHKDYTLKAYSKYNSQIKDSTGSTNMINMDGQSGSGFTNSSFAGMNAATSTFDCCKYKYCAPNNNDENNNNDNTNNNNVDTGDVNVDIEWTDYNPEPIPEPDLSGVRDVSVIEVRSLADVFENSNNVGEFFAFLWYNPWTMVVWFTLW